MIDLSGFAIIGPMAVQLRSDAINLARLRAWAEEWDHEGDGACWPAARFVQWVERNLAGDGKARTLETREAGQRRRRIGLLDEVNQ